MSEEKKITRIIDSYAFNPEWMRRQMVFLAGPRQVGKTWIAQKQLAKRDCREFYFNLDNPTTAEKYLRSKLFFESDIRNKASGTSRPLIVLDEVHKRQRWKHELKGIYDATHDVTDILVTGSARLDLLRVTGESMAGRYLLYRVLPLGLQEVANKISLQPPEFSSRDFLDQLSAFQPESALCRLLVEMGGFPDPLVMGSSKYRLRWAMDYRRLLLREDLRELSRIQEIDKIEHLWSLLPPRVRSPLSIHSLQNELASAHASVKNWLLNLERLYSIFKVKPWSKRISRSLLKEPKIYLMDWASHVDEANRFENFILSSLFRSTAIWTDAGFGAFDMFYVRNRDGQEADFLITKDEKPILIGDVKLTSDVIDAHIFRMSDALGKIPIIQVVNKPGVHRVYDQRAVVLSADRFLMSFP